MPSDRPVAQWLRPSDWIELRATAEREIQRELAAHGVPADEHQSYVDGIAWWRWSYHDVVVAMFCSQSTVRVSVQLRPLVGAWETLDSADESFIMLADDGRLDVVPVRESRVLATTIAWVRLVRHRRLRRPR